MVYGITLGTQNPWGIYGATDKIFRSCWWQSKGLVAKGTEYENLSLCLVQAVFTANKPNVAIAHQEDLKQFFFKIGVANQLNIMRFPVTV